jgi:hypothetical protein
MPQACITRRKYSTTRSGNYVALATISAVLLGAAGIASAVTGAAASSAPVITTIAGGDGGPGVGTSVAVQACAVSTGADETYISVNGVVWRLNPATDAIAPVAGVSGGVKGDASNGAPALTAGLKDACGMFNDSHGNLVIATPSNEIRVVARQSGTYYGQKMTVGRIYTIAGTGTAGFTGDGIPAIKAELDHPDDVSADSSGNLVLGDTGSSRVLVVAEKTGSFYGQSMKAGDIYTLFIHSGVRDALVDKWGNVVGFDTGTGLVWVYAETTGTYYGQSMTKEKCTRSRRGLARRRSPSTTRAISSLGHGISSRFWRQAAARSTGRR